MHYLVITHIEYKCLFFFNPDCKFKSLLLFFLSLLFFSFFTFSISYKYKFYTLINYNDFLVSFYFSNF